MGPSIYPDWLCNSHSVLPDGLYTCVKRPERKFGVLPPSVGEIKNA
jgi:hypothetical protein